MDLVPVTVSCVITCTSASIVLTINQCLLGLQFIL